MASKGATYELEVLLSYKDKLSKGLDQSLAKLKGLSAATEQVKRREVSATERAARQVERITAQTTRQSEQHARLRERIVTQSAARAATAQVREQRRASNEMIRLIDKVRREEHRSERRKGPGRAAQFTRAVTGLRPGGGYGGYYGNPVSQAVNVGQQTFDKIRGFTDPALEQVRAENRFQLLGYPKEDQAKAQAAIRKTTADVKGVRTVDAQEVLIGLVTTMGSISEAIELLPMATKHLANVEAIYGDKFGRNEAIKQVTDAARAIELIGKDQDINETKRYLNFFAQATMATGGDIDPAKIKAFTKYGNIAAMQMSPEGWSKFLPIIQQMGGAQAGTALTSLYSSVVGGTIPKEKLSLWNEKGLLDKSKVVWNKQGGVKKLRPGAIPMAEGMAEDPVAFADRYAEYLRTKEKIDTADPANIEKIATNIEAMFGNRTAKRQIAQMIVMREAIRKETAGYERAPGIEGTYGHVFAPENVLGKVLAEKAKKTDTAAAIGKPLAEVRGEIATVLTPFYEWVRTTSEAHPHIAAASAATLSFGASALTASDGVSRLTGAISAITGTGGGGGVAGTGVGVSDLITGAWAGGKGIKAVGGAAARGGLGMLGKVPGPLGIAALIGALGYGLYNKDDKDTGDSPAPHRYNKKISVDLFRQLSPEYKQPEGMKGLIRDVDERVKSGKITKSAGEQTIKIAEIAFPESYKTATSELAGVMEKVRDQASPLGDTFVDLLKPTRTLPDAFGTASTAAARFADRVGGLHVGGSPVFGGQDSGGGSGPKPSMQTGTSGSPRGYDSNTGSQSTHSMTAPKLISSARSRGGITINSPVHVNVPAGSRAADDPQALAELVAAELQRQAPALVAMVDEHTDFRVGNILERG